MHLAIGELASSQKQNPLQNAPEPDSAVEEIGAYVAARDTLVQEAVQNPTEATIKRARLANDFVANCLKPARAPYQAQFLPEADSTRELQRCRDLATRIGALSPR